jgi:hypothetical protein
MELPEEEVEQEIILKETFRVGKKYDGVLENEDITYPTLAEIERTAAAPWWIMEIVTRSVRYSRTCPYVENKASIRATNRSLEHTYASVEIENGRVANLRHAYYGLRLALRGRLELRADVVDFDNPQKAVRTTDALVADFMWNVFEDIKNEWQFLNGTDWPKLAGELASGIAGSIQRERRIPDALLSNYPELGKTVNLLYKAAPDRVNPELINDSERKLYRGEDGLLREEANYSALETLTNIAIHKGVLDTAKAGNIFIAQKYKN